jgi:NAD(P)-dependent dehydrogenase (short-subunit alcohol dehydrogenase family)
MAFEGFNLAGKTALVTGSARGNGSSLARAGASVAILDRPEMAQPAYAVRGEILAPGLRARVYELDVTRTAENAPTVDRVVQDIGALDILVTGGGQTIQ